MNIPTSEYRRMAREAMKGRLLYLTLISLLVAASGLGFFNALALSPGVVAAMAGAQLFTTLLTYGQEHIFLRRFRGEAESPALLFQFRMLPRLAAVFLLRDAAPMVLLEIGARLPATNYPQLARASGFQLAGLILQAVMVYNYGMAEYMLINDPSRSPLDALRASRRALSGNRLKLLLLSLSFVGWMLLARIPDILCAQLLPKLAPLAASALSLIWTCPLLTYVQMSQTAFFEVITGHRAVGGESLPQEAPPVPARSARDAAAWEMLDRNGFSRSRMAASGELSAYLSLDIPPEQEALWRGDWLNVRIERYPIDPDRMDEALLCAAEYADAPALKKALAAMDAALSSGQVIEGMIARQALSLARALHEGDGDWASEARDALAALADRLENRLSQIDPGGSWQGTVAEIRALARQEE